MLDDRMDTSDLEACKYDVETDNPTVDDKVKVSNVVVILSSTPDDVDTMGPLSDVKTSSSLGVLETMLDVISSISDVKVTTFEEDRTIPDDSRVVPDGESPDVVDADTSGVDPPDVLLPVSDVRTYIPDEYVALVG